MGAPPLKPKPFGGLIQAALYPLQVSYSRNAYARDIYDRISVLHTNLLNETWHDGRSTDKATGFPSL